jgi:hypothetical protein
MRRRNKMKQNGGSLNEIEYEIEIVKRLDWK